MNTLIFNKGQGGIGTPLAGLDYVSGLLFYSGATLPTGFTSSDRIKTVFSVEDAEDLGITNASLGETKSTSTYTVTAAGAAGDTMVAQCAIHSSTSPIASDAAAGTVTLCSYTQVTADVSTTTTAATRLAAEINLGTPTHGFTATSALAVVTITAPAGQGVFLNTGTPYTKTIVGTLAITIVQNVVAGVASDIDIMHYHISEYFRMQPKGKLNVGIYATADVGTFASITLMQNSALGEMRQIGVYYKSTAFSTAHLTTIQAIVTALNAVYRPLEVIVGGEISATSDLTLLSNVRLLAAPNVSICIGQDGAAQGFKLWKATAKSINNVGSTLGAVSLAAVNEYINWYGKFNASNGVEMEYAAFANGTLANSLSTGTITNLDTYGYIFAQKVIDQTGTYWNSSATATPISGDYNVIPRNRSINKAIRGMRAYLTPLLASPVKVNTDGTLQLGVIKYFESEAQKALDQMVRDGELSAGKASVNANQDVISTSTLTIVVQLIPVGAAENIVVNVGFTTSITN